MLFQSFDAEQLPTERCAVPRCGWLWLIGEATGGHRPACRSRRATRGMVSAPEQASAALRRSSAGQERVFRPAATLAGVTRFVLDSADGGVGDTFHETRLDCCAFDARTIALNSAHANLQYVKQRLQKPSVRQPLRQQRGKPRSLRTVDPGSASLGDPSSATLVSYDHAGRQLRRQARKLPRYCAAPAEDRCAPLSPCCPRSSPTPWWRVRPPWGIPCPSRAAFPLTPCLRFRSGRRNDQAS